MIYDLQKVLYAFGRLACGVTRKHQWKKPVWNGLDMLYKVKQCNRCGLVAPVKTRNRKKEKTE